MILMNNFKLIITSDMIKEVQIPFILVLSISLIIIIITTILVEKELKGVIKK
jgi:hypothetical protein